MKKLLLIILCLSASIIAFAQAPYSFKYQAVARDASGNVLQSQFVAFKISILQGSASGGLVYSEQHSLSTNQFGLCNLEIGDGYNIVGAISGIIWSSGPYFLKVEMDPAGGSSYSLIDTSQILSVPYSLHAQTAATSDELTLPYSGYVDNNSAFRVTNTKGAAVEGIINASGSTGTGVYGITSATSGRGVKGKTTATSGTTYGVYGEANSDNGFGLYGISNHTSGYTCGVSGSVSSSLGTAVSASSYAATGTTKGIHSYVKSSTGYSGYFQGGRFFISGNVGIGYHTPFYKLDVAGPANLNRGKSGVALRINGDEALWYNDTYFSWGYGATYNYFARKVVIGTSANPGGYMLAVSGAAAKSGGGSWSTWSDSRLKDIHENYNKGLNEIASLQPVKYNYRKENQAQLPHDEEYIGLVAQEVQKAFPEAVTEGSDGYLLLNQDPVNMALINSVKELKNKNDRLTEENNEIKERLARIEAMMEQDN